MGAEQSSNRGAAAADNAPQKTDYYELLGVDNHAGDDEIKKAYRKKALELHPDRNYGDVERATQKFAEVQAAYEVLSDPQERAWYDSHRDAILRGDDPTDDKASAPTQYHNVRLTTTDEIYALIGRFNKTVPLDDSPGSFFTVLRETFDRIADAEYAAAAAEDPEDGLVTPIEYPSFGTSQDDDKSVKVFYVVWQNFSTRLSFAWRDRWRLADAPDRRVRRLMEKENKKLREDAAREFADAVRSLVVFVRKRDPRYAPNTQSEAERQKVLRDAAAAQAARSRAAHQEKLRKNDADEFIIPEWAQSRSDEKEAHVGEFTESEDESEVEQIECVVCSKTFKSERQYEAHEKSKKHLKAVQLLRRQMKKENANLDLDLDLGERESKEEAVPTTVVAADEEEPPEDDDGDNNNNSTNNGDVDEQEDFEDDSRPETPLTEATTGRAETASRITTAAASDEDESEEDDDEYASRDAVEARLTGGAEQTKANTDDNKEETAAAADDDLTLAGQVGDIALQNESEDGSQPPPSSSQRKMGKAKAKREKKAARQAVEAASGSHICTGCNTTFDSRTRLFKHLEESGHAALKTTTTPTTKSGGKKKKKR